MVKLGLIIVIFVILYIGLTVALMMLVPYLALALIIAGILGIVWLCQEDENENKSSKDED